MLNRFSLLMSSSRQIRTLIVAVVGVDVFLLNQGSPSGDHWCTMVMKDYSRLQPHSNCHYPHMKELLNLMHKDSHNRNLALLLQRHMPIMMTWWITIRYGNTINIVITQWLITRLYSTRTSKCIY